MMFYNNILETSENLYMYFNLGDSTYAINIQQVVEIMKLPLLEYPQKLDNNVIGLLNYNNFTINILDLRFYLNLKVTPYSLANQLLIVKTDESIFGLLVDEIGDIIDLEQSKIEYFQFNVSGEEKLIEFLYKKEKETISIINLYAVENVLKRGIPLSDIDIPSLFPHDDDSRYKFMQRTLDLLERSRLNLVTKSFSQGKFISFALAGGNYCINLEYVKEFSKNIFITKVPCDLDYIVGIMTLRGDFVTVIDLKKFLDLNEFTTNPNNSKSKNSIIIIETSDFTVAFLVDEIFKIIDISEELMNKNFYNRGDKNVLSEVILEDELLIILNMKAILSDERFFIEDNS